jgi:hypothetical protein
MQTDKLIARWETRNGKHFCELTRHERDGDPAYSYRGNGCGGSLGVLRSDDDAVSQIVNRIGLAYFAPDAAKIGLRLVFRAGRETLEQRAARMTLADFSLSLTHAEYNTVSFHNSSTPEFWQKAQKVQS